MMIQIREVRITDAVALATLLCQLDTETEFLALGELRTIAELSCYLQLVESSTSQCVYVVEQGQGISRTLVGFAIGSATYITAELKALTLVIGLRQAYTKLGLGQQLLVLLELWARLLNFDYLALTVMKQNENAILFYKRNGFEEKSLNVMSNIDGELENTLYMDKLLSKE